MTIETVLRRIEKQCRENIRAFGDYKWKHKGYGRGAIGEARGCVTTCEEIKTMKKAVKK